MMRRLLVVLFFVLLALVGVGGETISSLQEQIRKAQEEIRAGNALLEKNRKEQKMTITQLKLIESKIENRKNIILSLEKQIDLLNRDISDKNSNIEELKRDLKALKAEYASMVYLSYKNYKVNNFALFIFSAQDFNGVVRRMAMIDRYNGGCERKAGEIDSLAKSLNTKVVALNAQKAELDRVRSTRGKELLTLSDDQKSYQNSAEALKENETKLAGSVRARQAQIDKAQAEIRRIMAEEARKAKAVKRSAEEEKQMTALSSRFDQNLGKLPFPVSGGVIIDRYGRHQHPTEKRVVTNNPGINIAAPSGADVRCVFDGEVHRVFFHPATGNGVLINHGNYNTIYSNLAEVTVKQGEKVTVNQRIGKIASSDDTDECRLHFELWRGMATLDPGLWLRK